MVSETLLEKLITLVFLLFYIPLHYHDVLPKDVQTHMEMDS